jgi:hypothetical protein
LAFAEPVPRFITLDGSLRRVKCPTSPSRIHKTFHKPVILFYPSIQLFALSEPTGLWAGVVLWEGVEGWWGCGVLGDGDHPGREHV